MNILLLDFSFMGKIQNREKTVAHINIWLKHSGTNITILSTNSGCNYYKNIFLDKISYIYFAKDDIEIKSKWTMIFIYLRNILLIKQFKILNIYDILYSPTSQPPDLLAIRILSKKIRSKLCLNFDNFVPNPFQRPGNFILNLTAFLAHKISIGIYRNVDLVFAYLNEANYLKLNKILKKFENLKLIRFDNGIDLDKIKSIRSDNKYLLTYLGRIHEAKGIFDFLDIVLTLRKYNIKFSAAIAGNGDLMTLLKVRKFIENNSLNECIDILGFVSTQEKYELLKSSTFYIAPSYDDSYPVGIIEAYLCGCKIFVYDLPVFLLKPYSTMNLNKTSKGNSYHIAESILNIYRNGDITYFPINENLIPSYKKNAETEYLNFEKLLS